MAELRSVLGDAVGLAACAGAGGFVVPNSAAPRPRPPFSGDLTACRPAVMVAGQVLS